jgi:hypothetical protein
MRGWVIVDPTAWNATGNSGGSLRQEFVETLPAK